MSKEIWKNVEGANNYQVSNLGRVRSKERMLIMDYKRLGKQTHRQQLCPEQLLNPQRDNCGYVHVRLTCDDGKVRLYKVHRLVAQTFMKDFNPELHVDHINGVKTDNRLKNLQLLTFKQNLYKAYYSDKKHYYICKNTDQRFVSFKCFCKRNNIHYSYYYFLKALDTGQCYNGTDLKFEAYYKN